MILKMVHFPHSTPFHIKIKLVITLSYSGVNTKHIVAERHHVNSRSNTASGLFSKKLLCLSDVCEKYFITLI